ncbi:DUF3726 domain-containing protein [Kiloniella sp. EL199]|uniref:DUF3726 domain-containing protein n=1 Tax=Kiloniella sp. EL199 TaxID=2107581 RepID=UPI000EA04D19|nr:DUF3726 domain-containing protein [Kiloniella sp. EL199]
MERYSLNEIEASARKAARGAGMSWGLAEEAGKATRWLAARGLPNVCLLLSLLKTNDGKAYNELRPQSLDLDIWNTPNGPLCPVISGSALNDLADRLLDRHEIILESVISPALILPILGRAAKAIGKGFSVSWFSVSGGAVKVIIAPDVLYLEQGTINDLGTEQAERVSVSGILSDLSNLRAEKSGTIIERVVQGVPLSSEDWADLQAFAARTYVPATEESRLKGAGAGLSDND